MSLYEVLKNSSGLLGDQKTSLNKYGYEYDSGLSSRNIQVYYNPNNKTLLYTVKGTDPKKSADIRTDISLALGNLKGTKRYKDAEKQLVKATEKYNPNKRILAGYSLGGSIVSNLGSKGKGDSVYTYNKGATLGQKTRNIEKGYRTRGDIVSVASAKDVKTLKKTPSTLDLFGPIGSALSSHQLDQLKKQSIDIPSLTPFTPIQFQQAGQPVTSTPTTIEGQSEE
jgi:hypothetical protein